MELTHPFKLTPAGRATATVPLIVPRRTGCDLRKCKGPKSGPACPRQLSITADAHRPSLGTVTHSQLFRQLEYSSKHSKGPVKDSTTTVEACNLIR